MTQNQIYASALRTILDVIDFDKDETHTDALGVKLLSIRDMAGCALVDGTVAHQGAAHLHAQRIENARLRALAI